MSRKDLRAIRLRSLLDNEPRIGPQTVHFDIANACNMRCSTCWHHSPLLEAARVPSVQWKRQTMSPATFRAILDDLLSLGGLEQIILSGMGEPTLNDALYEMVAYAHHHGIGVTIITNLVQVDVPRLLDSSGELNLLVSICAASRQVWEAFHGGVVPKGFERLIENLDILRGRGFKPKHVQVINSQNYHELVEMVRFTQRWPAKRINFKLASLGHGTEVFALDREQKIQLRDDLIPRAQALAKANAIETDLQAFQSQIFLDSHRTSPIEDVGCFMGLLYCRITVDCELLYCCNSEISVGVIDEKTSFRTLWEGEPYQAIRMRLRRGEYFDSCGQCGKYKQNLKWSHKLRARRGADKDGADKDGADKDGADKDGGGDR